MDYFVIYLNKPGKDIRKTIESLEIAEYFAFMGFRYDRITEKQEQRLLKKLEKLPSVIFLGYEWRAQVTCGFLKDAGCTYECQEIPFFEFSNKLKEFYDSISLEDYSIKDFFYVALSNWYGETNDSDCITYDGHDKKNSPDMCLYPNFGINREEEILFMRDTSSWNDRDEGLVITDKAVYYRPLKNIHVIKWKEINRVEYEEDNFYFYNANEERITEIGKKYFFKKISNEELEGFVGEIMARNLTIMAKIAGEPSLNKIVHLEKSEQFDEALAKMNGLMSEQEVRNDAFAHFLKGRMMLKKNRKTGERINEQSFKEIEGEFQKAMELSEKAMQESLESIEREEDNPIIFSNEATTFDYRECDYWRAYNYLGYDRKHMARNLFLDAMSAESEEIREDAKEKFITLEEQMRKEWNNYTENYDYKDRKFIMPINDSQIAGCRIEGIETFRMSNIPSCIKFPTGHPIAGELYIGHPYNPEVYVPYENSEDAFFVDKIHELCYLLQCLGAEEISITSIKGKSVSELTNNQLHIDGQADIKGVSLNGEILQSGSRERAINNNVQRTIVQRFDPLRKPYVPEKLIWYPEQTTWQRLADSRLNGNLLEHNEYISTSDTRFVSTSEREAIKASAEYLWAKIGGSVETKSETQFKESVETQWKVEVKFRSMKLFANEEQLYANTQRDIAQFTKNEQQYIESLKEFLEDDAEITPRERKMLDRIRLSLGISEERAAELEATLKPQLTEDEQEYFEMFCEYAEKGEITEKERRRLDKFAAALGIEDSRIKEIEHLAD